MSERMFNLILAISAVLIVIAPVVAVAEFDSRHYAKCAFIMASWAFTVAGLIYWGVA